MGSGSRRAGLRQPISPVRSRFRSRFSGTPQFGTAIDHGRGRKGVPDGDWSTLLPPAATSSTILPRYMTAIRSLTVLDRAESMSNEHARQPETSLLQAAQQIQNLCLNRNVQRR